MSPSTTIIGIMSVQIKDLGIHINSLSALHPFPSILSVGDFPLSVLCCMPDSHWLVQASMMTSVSNQSMTGFLDDFCHNILLSVSPGRCWVDLSVVDNVSDWFTVTVDG